MQYGATDISPSLQSSLASRQFVSSLTEAANGEYMAQKSLLWHDAMTYVHDVLLQITCISHAHMHVTCKL